MILIEQKVEMSTALSGLSRDIVTMTWEERRKSRQKLTTRDGLELALALPTGSILENGDIIYLDNDRYVAVEAAEEDVLCIRPERLEDYVLAAYEIGNRHLPLSIAHSLLSTLYEPLLEAHFKKHGIECERRQIPFEPVVRRGHAH
jgi:urease accessory protein